MGRTRRSSRSSSRSRTNQRKHAQTDANKDKEKAKNSHPRRSVRRLSKKKEDVGESKRSESNGSLSKEVRRKSTRRSQPKKVFSPDPGDQQAKNDSAAPPRKRQRTSRSSKPQFLVALAMGSHNWVVKVCVVSHYASCSQRQRTALHRVARSFQVCD